MSIPPSTNPMQAWYEITALFPGVWRIAERGVNCYLVTGSERALLIDTGWGFGDLAGVVASLTTLPVTAVITHGHPDHTNGTQQFADVWMNPADNALALRATPEGRRRILEMTASRGPLPDWFDAEVWVNTERPTPQALADDAAFALGGRTLQVIPTPGHTPGSVCLLDPAARLLFTGDTVVPGTILLFLPDSLPLSTYARSIAHLLSHRVNIDFLLPGHGDDPLPPSMLDDLLRGAEAIMQGEVTGEPQQTFLGNGLCADFGTCKICYKPDKLS